jgi:transposase
MEVKITMMNRTVNNFVGVDISKKNMEVLRFSEYGRHERFQSKTTKEGEMRLAHWLQPDDIVILEAGSQTFRIAKRLQKQGFEAIVLNPGDVKMIYASLRKTDKEDALKLARLAHRNPREELPEVNVPSDIEEDARRLTTEQKHWTTQQTINKNRLHSLFTQAGLTDITKKHISSHKSREKVIPLLSERYQREAQRLQSTLQHLEETIAEIEKEIQDNLKNNIAYTELAMSMPGIGPITAHTFLSYLGDCNRFSSSSQVSYYAGLVPRVSQSGETEQYGKIIKRGCTPIRRVIIQGAWALVKSKHGGVLKEFYERLYPRIGKKKAIVATARKMVETFYAIMKSGELYRGMPQEEIDKKMRHYGLIH